VVLSGLPAGNWTINPGAIAGNTASTTINNLVGGTYNFTVTVSGCSSPASSTIIIIPASSSLSVSVAAQTNVSCHGNNNGYFTVTGTGGIAPYSYRLGTGAFQSSSTFSASVAGTYNITIRDAVQCEANTIINITEPPVLALPYTTEESSCPDFADGKLLLAPSGGTPPYNILWSDGSTAANRTGILSGTYDVILSDANNCSSLFKVILGHNIDGKCLQIQEIMTPNNDGFYDNWKIKNIDMYPDAEVQVFNRWGERVFSTRNLSANPWDGTFNGKPLPTDSYHFILYLEKGLKPITGTISIIR
jgi:gliding motility-associated-like protein